MILISYALVFLIDKVLGYAAWGLWRLWRWLHD